MKITIETLTPLWTGGIDNTADQIHATGIIGVCVGGIEP